MLKTNGLLNFFSPGRWTTAGRVMILLFFLVSTVFTSALGGAFPAAAQDQPTQPGQPGGPINPEPDVVEPVAPASPDTNLVLPASIFGLEMTPVGSSGGMYWAQQIAYARWVRGPEIVWKDVELSPGVYTWSAINNAVTEIQNAKNVSNGSSVIVIVRGTPSFYQANPPFSCGPIKPANYAALGTFMFNLINHLETVRGINYVKEWEIWNEPDNPPVSSSDPDQPWGGCWGNPADAYYGGEKFGEMLKVIYPTIKTRDPAASVIVGGLNMDCDPRYPPPVGKTDCNSSKFLEGILKVGAGQDYFDGIAFHAFDYIIKDSNNEYMLGRYHNPNWPGSAWNQNGPALAQKAKYIYSLLDKYKANIGPTTKFLMNTENALLDDWYTTNTRPYPIILETTKSYYVAHAYAAAYSVGLKANVWFDLTGTWLRNNGLVMLDGSDSLEAYESYLFMAANAGNSGSPAFISEFRYLNPLSTFPGVVGHEFGVIPTAPYNPYHIWMMWSKDGAIHQITLPTIAQAVYGVKGGAPVFSNVQVLNITPQPYYIIMFPVVGRSKLPLIKRSVFNGDFESGFTNWTTVSGPSAPLLPASLQTSKPANPLDPSGNTLDTSVPSGSTSALLGNSSLGFGQSKGSCSYPNVPVGFVSLNRGLYIPPLVGGNTAELSFNYIIYSQDSTGGTVDRFELWIQPYNLDGTPAAPESMAFADGNTSFVYNDRCRWYRVPSSENPRTDQPGDPSITSGWAKKTLNVSAYTGKILKVSFRMWNRPDGWFNSYAYLDNVSLDVIPAAP